jgi:hypothetical protein
MPHFVPPLVLDGLYSFDSLSESDSNLGHPSQAALKEPVSRIRIASAFPAIEEIHLMMQNSEQKSFQAKPSLAATSNLSDSQQIVKI